MKVRKRFLVLCMALAVAVTPGSAVTGHAAQSETAGASAEEFLTEELRMEEDADLEKDADLGKADIVISSTDDLRVFAANVGNGNTYEGQTVRLSRNIAFDGTTLNNFEPVGAAGRVKFEGTFDGRGFTVSGIYQAGQYWAGLFYSIGSNGVVKNLTVKNILIQNATGTSGAIASYNYGEIRNCRVTDSTLSGGNCIGGCAGNNYGVINACEVVGTSIQGCDSNGEGTGGIAGWSNGKIMNCLSDAALSGGCAGGIVGKASSNSVINCANLGEITTYGQQYSVVQYYYGFGGGIVGYSSGSNVLQNCYSIGMISSDSHAYIGSLIGSVSGTDMLSGCYYSLEGCSQAYGSGSPSVQNDVTAKTKTQMKSQGFLTQLNKNRSQNPDWIPWLFRSGSDYPAHETIYDIRTNSVYGKVDYSMDFAWSGQKVTFTVTPDKYYRVKSVTVKNSSGTSYTVEKTSSGYSFTMPSCSVNVAVTYAFSMPISECSAYLSKTDYTYSGKAKTPAVTVKNGSKTLKSGTDYTVKYASNVNAGTAKVTVTGKGSYSGSRVLYFRIEKAAQKISLPATSYTKVDGAAAFKLGAKVKTGKGKLSYSSSNKKVVTVDKNGKVTVKGPGYAEITVTAGATTNYEKAVKKVSVTVKPKKAALRKLGLMSGRRLKVFWKSTVPNASGYIVEYSIHSSFKNSQKVNVTNEEAKNVILKGLTKNRNYYVRIYTYKVTTKNGVKKQILSDPSAPLRSGKIKK